MTYRIWLDMDSVIYDLSSAWYSQHNEDYPNHDLRIEHVTGWDTQEICRLAGCDSDIYSYFNNPKTWTQGAILGNSNNITQTWLADIPNIHLGILTTAANGMSMPLKVEWLTTHFPHIKDIVIVNGHLKHLVSGDILIDDAIHNVQNYPGIRILYDQTWNRDNDAFIRANGKTDEEKWLEVDRQVRRAIQMLDNGYSHKTIERVLKDKHIKWV